MEVRHELFKSTTVDEMVLVATDNEFFLLAVGIMIRKAHASRKKRGIRGCQNLIYIEEAIRAVSKGITYYENGLPGSAGSLARLFGQ